MKRCRSCGKPIVWIKMQTGNWMPCDEGMVPYKQDPEGPATVIAQHGEAIRCRLEFDGIPTGLARTSHFATCPDADKFRNRGRN